MDHPVFVGPVEGQELVDPAGAPAFRAVLVHFADGATSKLHTHTVDQLLIVSDGVGVVGTAEAQYEVGPGDVIYTAAGEAHIHGAAPGSSMAHYAVMGFGGETSVVADAPHGPVEVVGPIGPALPAARHLRP